MHISIFGMGYVGCVTAACLAKQGHNVVAVESDEAKYALLANGVSPVIEAALDELIADAVKQTRLHMANTAIAIKDTDISLVCVGTPSRASGEVDSSIVQGVCEEIGNHLASKDTFHVVVIRSTILPGTLRKIIIPALERTSGKKAGIDFGVCNNPEFLREGVAVTDYFNPPKIVIGETDTRSGDRVQSLYKDFSAEIIRCPIETGEMVKYADNAWHAIKVNFANEIGRLCKVAGIDSHQVMNIFCKDTKLNLSSYYMKPGFAYGGSCLPKDLRALNYMAQSLGIEIPLLASASLSNASQIAWGLQMILRQVKKKIGFLGVSFKAGTDDVRESPMLEIIKQLAQHGYDLSFYDPHCNIALAGLKKKDTLDALLNDAEVIVISHNTPEFTLIADRLRPAQVVIDFVRIAAIEKVHANYHGICW